MHTLRESEVGLDLLSDVARSFCTRDAVRVRALRDAGGEVDRAMWGRLADNGWLSILVPEELGGAGIGVDAVAIVARALGRGAFPEPFAAAGVLAPVVLAAAGDAKRLAAVLAGEALVGVGWRPGVTVEADGRLRGETRFIGVAGADAYVVAARGEAGLGLYWVDAGWVETAEPRADGTRTARVRLDGRAATELVAPGGGAEALLDGAVDVARVAVSAELIGVADAALELTLEYLRQRHQFGRPIGSFQALQHRAVDMWMARELAAAALQSAVAVFVDPESAVVTRARAASGLKARAVHAVQLVCTGALQCHGAIGFTDEYDLGLYLNRALALAPWLGNATEQRRRWLELSR
jgi:alkylation response protein AidB-like acyl-CoA dehydrogenase